MKKIVIEVIKLIALNIVINIFINLLINFIHIEISEFVAYIIFLLKHIIIIYVGIKHFWKDLDSEAVKKISLIFMIIIIAYNIFDVAKSISEYEESLSIDFSSTPIQYDENLNSRERKELEEARETVRQAGQNIQNYMKENRDEYYALLIRVYVVIYSIIAIVLYCFVAPKWFNIQGTKNKKNQKFDFYNDFKE